MYTVEHLEGSRWRFEPLPILRALLTALLKLDGGAVSLLDCGCGTGFFTRQYARLPGVKAVGLDMDGELLQAAEKLASKEGLDVSFVKGDIQCLPFPEGRFDCAVSDILLEIFPNMAQPVGELARVCKSGGRVLCMEPNYRSYVYYDPRLSQEDNRLMTEFFTAGRSFGAGPELPEVFNRVGLTDVEMVPWFWRGEDEPDADEFLQNMEQGLSMTIQHGALSEGERGKYQALFHRAASARRESSARVLTGLDVYLICGGKSKAG